LRALFEKENRGWLLAGVIVILAILLGNLELLTGKLVPQWDAADFFGPQFSFLADHIKAGRLVLWDPWVSGGAPDLAEPELGSTSPLMLLMGLLSPNPQAGFITYWMVVWILGGAGVLLLAKHLGSPMWGALIVALGFIASGFYTGHAEHTSSLYSVSLLPWVLWRFDAALLRRNYWFGVQAGALYGLSALGGYPEFTILTPLFLFLWAVGRIFRRESHTSSESHTRIDGEWRRLILPAVLILCLTVGIGSAVCSPGYGAFLTGTHGYSDRVGPRSRVESTSSNIFPAQALSTLSSPYLSLLNMPPNPIWAMTDVSMSSIYIGSAVLLFSLFALRRRSAWRWWLAAVALFLICCAVGNQLPVRGWLYDLVIPTRYFRNPAMFRVYFMLVLIVLAALGSKDLCSPDERKGRSALLALSIALAAGATASFAMVVHIAGKTLNEYHLAVVHLTTVWFGVLLLAILLRARLISRTSLVRLVAVLAAIDAVVALHIAQPTMYTDVPRGWWHAMNAGEDRRLDLPGRAWARQLDSPAELGLPPGSNRNLALKIATFRNYAPLTNRFQSQFIADPMLSGMALGPNRIWFSSHPVWLAPDNAHFQKFSEAVHALRRPVLVLHTTAQMLSISEKDGSNGVGPGASDQASLNSAECSQASVSSVSYRPNFLSFRYVAEAPGWLLVTDRWAPGWKVSVNGKPQQVLGGNFIFRAVRVEAGANYVEFKYRPAGFFALLAVSWSTLLLVALGEVYRMSRSKNHESASHTLEPALV